MADYCAPCHSLAKMACVALIASEAIGLFLGWQSLTEIWMNVLMLQVFTLIIIYLECKCLSFVVLPWQIKLLRLGSSNPKVPFLLSSWQTSFIKWAIGVEVVSLTAIVSLQYQAVRTGKAFQNTTNYGDQCMSGFCFLATLVSLIWAVVWSYPVHSDVRWEFGRDRN